MSTFNEMVNQPELTDGTEVNVRIGETTFSGKIVGKATTGLIPNYIVECTDGTLPNDVYDYRFVSMPLSEISTKDSNSKSKRMYSEEQVIELLLNCPFLSDRETEDFVLWFESTKN